MTRTRSAVLGALAGSLLVGASLAGCATRGEVEEVASDLALFKAEATRRDSARAAQLAEVVRQQRLLLDSLAATHRVVATVRGDLANELYDVHRQLVQLQELTGQSQQRLRELRDALDRRREEMANAAPPPAAGADTAAGSATGAGAASPASADQMYEASIAQLRRGSAATARLGLRELLRVYPTSERAPDALYFIGQSFATENPDSAAAYYQQVVQNYPSSARAPSALYNLGLVAERRKNSAAARDTYQRVVQNYPQSDEAALARDRLRALGR